MHLRHLSFVLLTTRIAFAAAAQPAIKPVAPILLRSGSGITHLILSNPTNAPIPLDLKTGPVTDSASGVRLPTPKITYALEPGEATPPPPQLKPGQSLTLVLSVASLTGTSSAHMQLFNADTELAPLDAVALDDLLAVTIDDAGSADTPLLSVYKKPALIRLKNSSSEFLALSWTLTIDGLPEGSGEVELPPTESRQIAITPDSRAYPPTDYLRPGVQTGRLELRLKAPAGVPPDLVPMKVLPVNLLLSGSTAAWTTLLSYLFVSACLMFGGLLSILASAVLPNIMRKIDLRRRLSILANRTSSISTRVDSYLRVLLRLERKNIDVLLGRVGPFSLTAVDQFEDITVAIDRLIKRLTVAERLDELRRRFEDASATAPPSISDTIDRILDLAAGQLHSFVLPDEDIDVANDLLDKAEASMKLLDDKDAQAKLIAANFIQLKGRLKAFPSSYWPDLKKALPGIFQILSEDFDDPRNIFPPMFFAIDHDIAAAQTTLNYAMVRATIPRGMAENCDSAGHAAMARLRDHECELINLLGTLSWKSLRGAAMLVQQMREDIYEDDVLEQIELKRAKIVFDTQRARPFLPVYFSIAFDDPRFNGAAALDWLNIRWTFPNDLIEEGWKVCHYFQGDEAAPGARPKVAIRVEAESPRLNRKSELSAQIELQPSSPPREYSGAIAGTLRFLIAFGVALAGLESGAIDQLNKLGFLQATLAIIALGFGADAVKNLLTQSSSRPSPVSAAKS